MTRRQVLAAALGGATLAAAAGGASVAGIPEAEAAGGRGKQAGGGAGRLPVIFLPHGGGPWPYMDGGGFFERREAEAMTAYLRSLRTLAHKPRALLCVSAHWEESVPTVMTGERPPLFFDYYGFPPDTYKLTWPAPGEPALANRVRQLLEAAGFPSGADAARGFDHGTFVPLKVAFPEADIPTVQLSLKKGLDPAEHLAIGRALAPLRDEGVLIVGSGMSYHNMRGFGGAGVQASETFDAWLQKAATAEPAARDAQLSRWSAAPAARAAHPREEHLLPLMVIAGAAGSDVGRAAYSDTFARVRISAFHYG